MIDEVASDPSSENQNRNWWQRFGNWISEHGDEHGFILGGFVFAGLIAGFILRECLSVRHSDKIPLAIGFISYVVTIAGLGVTNIFNLIKVNTIALLRRRHVHLSQLFSLG